MTEHRTLRIGGRTVLLVSGTSVEQWSQEHARARLQSIATEWPGREALLRLSDEMLGPDDDIDRAIEHLVRMMDHGALLALRLPVESSIGHGRASDADWDAPKLSELRRERDPDRARDDRGRADPRVPRSPSDRPGTAPSPSRSSIRTARCSRGRRAA